MTDRWRIRRKLIYGGVTLGTLMIIAGTIGIFQDRFAGELIYGGVTLITAIVSAYSGFATWDDKNQIGGSPDG